ncbi:MAG: hypothetical protein AB7O49_12795 [Sphingomonadales bacterium]
MTADHIWDILEIPETEDEASIRRAYALRLRKTNPEDDAEGFKQLRQAYDAALQRARWASANREWQERQAAHEEPGDQDEWDDGVWDVDDRATVGDGWPAHEPAAADGALDETAMLRRQAEADIEDHNKARMALADAIRENAPAATILEALRALFATRAMDQIDVYGNTGAWLIDVVHRYRPASEVLIDPMIAFFGWTQAAEASYQWNGPASILALRRELSREQAWTMRRAEPEVPRSAFRRFADRYLDFNNFLYWAIPLIGVVAFGMNVLGVFEPERPRERPRAEAGDQRPPIYIGTPDGARAGCREGARRWRPQPANDGPRDDPRGMAEARSVCEYAMAKIPGSPLLMQYAAIVELRTGHWQAALKHAEDILKISPSDPAALYIKGFAQSRIEPERRGAARLMRDALAIDGNVAERIRAFHVVDLPDIKPASSPRTYFSPRLLLPIDGRIEALEKAGQAAVDSAYRNRGFDSAVGETTLECLVGQAGRARDCRIREEKPWNRGVGEIAIAVVEQWTMTQPTKNGVPVDGVPMLFTYTFTAAPGYGRRLDTFDLADYDDEATGIVENELAASLTEAALAKKPAYVYGKFIDLDGNGPPEIVARLQSRFLCGDAARSCAYVMARKDKGPYELIFSVAGAQPMNLLDSTSQGWRDVQLGYAIWRYDGATYRNAGPSNPMH